MNGGPLNTKLEMNIEVVAIPVSDIERSKRFYTGLGWRLDADFAIDAAYRVVQFTPHGSSCSIHFGAGITSAAPGSARVYLVVYDIVAVRDELIARDVQVSALIHRIGPGPARLAGPHPQRQSYATFASFSDPDGNTWVLQEVTARLPGRVDSQGATFTSSVELEAALRRVATAHGDHERRMGKRDDDWPRWYSEYMYSEHTGKPLPN